MFTVINVLNFFIVECCIPFSVMMILVGRPEWHPACKETGCWFVGGNNLTVALHVLQLQLSSLPASFLVPIKSRMETFWYRLTPLHLEKWPFQQRERNSGLQDCMQLNVEGLSAAMSEVISLIDHLP